MNAYRYLLIAILLPISWLSSAVHAEVRCPEPAEIFKSSMTQARGIMDRSFAGAWDNNDLGCVDPYINLMSYGKPGICRVRGLQVDRFTAFGFEGGDPMVGVGYTVSSVHVGPSGNLPSPSDVGLEGMEPVDAVPETFSHIGAKDPSAKLYLSRAKDIYMEVSRPPSSDGIEIRVFNVVEFERQKGAIERCARQAGAWRD